MCDCVPCFSLWISDSKQTLTKDSIKFLLTRRPTKALTFSGPLSYVGEVTQESGGEHSEPIVGKRRASECRLRASRRKGFSRVQAL